MFAWQFARSLHVSERNGWARFVSMQNHYNLIYREEEREMNPLCRAEGVGLIPWSPLARGFLAGNRTADKGGDSARARTDDIAHRMYYQPDDFAVAERVQQVARGHDRKPAQIALAWLLSRPGVTAPIVGASTMEQLDDAVAALEVQLSGDEMKVLEEPYRPHAVLGHS
jgi:aryl-alcohol dehydrogenase (NADP+)